MPAPYNSVGPGSLSISGGQFVRRNAADTAWEAYPVQENIPTGTTSQYYRGDKTWQTLNASTVNLGNVDNTSDANKPISTATQNALDLKQDTIAAGTTSQYYRGDKSWQTLDKSSVGLSNVDNTSDLNKPISIATQTALDGKFNTPMGTTAQYIRGDGTLATLPSPGSGTVTSVGISSTDLSVSGSPVTTSGTITANLTVTGVAAGTYSSVTVDAKGRVSAGTQRSFSSASRSLNSVFQISTTRDSLVSYSVDISTSVSLSGGAVGTVYLEFADDSGFTTGVTETARFVNGNTGTLVVGLVLNQTNTAPLGGVIPAGKYVRLRTQNNTGTPTFTYRSGQEALL